MRRILSAAVGIAVVTALAQLPALEPQNQQPPPQPPPIQPQPAQPQTPQQVTQRPAPPPEQQKPTFRIGATNVRVDAFVTRNGEPVADLKAEDFEIREDNVPQTIRSFEYVNIPPAFLQTGEHRDPNTVAASREAASDPRKRVFVLFLDTYHVTQGSGMWSRSAMLKFLQRTIGPDDLIAGMTPDLPPDAVSFTSRTQGLESVLQTIYGKRDSIIDTEEEERIKGCFNPQEWPMYRDRRRAKLTLDALEALMFHLDGIREERKAIILVTEGWPMFREDPELSHERGSKRPPSGPGIIVGPGGRLGTTDPRYPDGVNSGNCDAVRLQIAAMETWQQFRDLPDIANRANASFYTVDPRGLAAFDAPMGPVAPPPVNIDQAILRSKLENLRELADRTDGLAVQNTNDLTSALNRIARDVSSYYLIGYDSTNPKLDGTYRRIQVTLKQPGLQVRARRGYRAPIDGRLSRARGGAAKGASAGSGSGDGSGGGDGAGSGAGSGAGGDVAAAVSALAATRADLPIRLRAATLRLDNVPAELRVLAELDSKTAANSVWQQGGTARIVVKSLEGETVAQSEAALGVGERTLAVALPLPTTIAPGEYRVQVRLTTSSKIDSVGDSVAFSVPARATTIGEPAVLRRGPSTGIKYVPTADLRFRRQERVRLEAPLVIPVTRVRATLVDSSGKSMSLPVQVTERAEGSARLAVVDLSLAPLAAGGYAVIVTDAEDTNQPRVLVPLQVVP